MKSITYLKHVIDISESETGYKYTIKKDEKLIIESGLEFPFPSEAEVHAKLYINRLNARKDGWIVS